MVTPKDSVHKLTQKLEPPYSVKKKTVNKQYDRKVLLSKFYFKGHMLGFHPPIK